MKKDELLNYIKFIEENTSDTHFVYKNIYYAFIGDYRLDIHKDDIEKINSDDFNIPKFLYFMYGDFINNDKIYQTYLLSEKLKAELKNNETIKRIKI